MVGRSHIIDASNQVIAPGAERMKTAHDITVNRARLKEPCGGELEGLDTIGKGRVQILRSAGTEYKQAAIAVEELLRLSRIVPEWDWAKTAIISRDWKFLQPVRS